MQSTPNSRSLEDSAERLQEKAKKADRAQNIEQRVSTARNDVKRITSALTNLNQSLRDLHFYADVLTEVFDQQQPAQVDDAIGRALGAVDITDEELLEEADEGRLLDIKDDIDQAEDAITNARSKVEEEIDDHVERWRDDIDSARELDRIISGGDSEFSQVLYNMDNFLGTDIDNPRNNPSALANRWERLKEAWDEEGGKQGWEAFQSEYDLSDSTVRRLRKFSEQKSVNLSQFTIENLEEIKQVDDLESAITLRIGSS